MNTNDEGFEDVQHDDEVMDDADVVLHALGGDALEFAIIQDFSDAITGALPVNVDSTDVARMEEDGDNDDAGKGRTIDNAKQVRQVCIFFQ